jgi:hypothetical protein
MREADVAGKSAFCETWRCSKQDGPVGFKNENEFGRVMYESETASFSGAVVKIVQDKWFSRIE